ncbi:uncharacterized protein LOC133731834 [Rosa rugosa]|uniref:uncharacterized protein LOC133731834 n=1 Tax=Rosa rugosa TaxID=74645 RepID=UPI002B415258|nr:uncharacterized protein LOC133731834 [Rosa rugosa]
MDGGASATRWAGHWSLLSGWREGSGGGVRRRCSPSLGLWLFIAVAGVVVGRVRTPASSPVLISLDASLVLDCFVLGSDGAPMVCLDDRSGTLMSNSYLGQRPSVVKMSTSVVVWRSAVVQPDFLIGFLGGGMVDKDDGDPDLYTDEDCLSVDDGNAQWPRDLSVHFPDHCLSGFGGLCKSFCDGGDSPDESYDGGSQGGGGSWEHRFRFESFWTLHEECAEVVKDGWRHVHTGGPMSQATKKIMSTRFSLNRWQRDTFGNKGREIAENQEECVVLSARLEHLLTEEHAYWKQRSKVTWLVDGDRNTKYFHRKASNRRAKNRIQGLFDDDGVWQNTEKGITGVVLDYFCSMYTAEIVDYNHMQSVVDLIQPKVTADMNATLCAPYTALEIRQALFQMYPTKAPGPDGMPHLFFQQYWDSIGGDVVKAAQSFLHSGRLLDEVNYTHVCLIPKVKNPVSMSDLRPIALCNVLYKICSKAIANRLKRFLSEIISPFQSAFIPGRLITDNTLIANEVSHFIHNCNSSTDGVLSLKLDMSKAYDSMEWCFLEAVLFRLGFDEAWIQVIMQCVSSVRYSFLINGQPKGYLSPSRGLRQGDPLSPYLFLLCTEAFSALLECKASAGLLQGIQVCANAPSIHHLLFADDSLIFGKAIEEECGHILSVLKDYEMASGQRINFSKSSIVFSKKVNVQLQQQLADLLGVVIVPKHEKYLGLPTYVGRKKSGTFSYIKERLSKKLEGWQGKLLSGAAKQGWRLIRYPNSLLSRIYKAKYYPDGDFWSASLMSSPSSCWRGIFEARSVLKNGVRWQVGDGQSIHIWDDPWLPRPSSFRPFIRRDGAPTLVRELLLPGLSWNSDVIAQWFEPEDVMLIFFIPLSQRSVSDRLIWHFDAKGLFSTKSAYKLAINLIHVDIPSVSNPTPFVETWKRIWAARIPGKVKVHMWKVCASILPTVAQLRTKRIWVNDGCVFCNDGDESIHHISRDCSLVHDMLRKVPGLSSVISSKSANQASILDWLFHCMQSLSPELFDFLLYLLWAVWKERNQRVWNSKTLELDQLFFQAASGFSLFTSLRPGRSSNTKRASTPWYPPPAGWLKANLDGAFDSSTNMGGIGVVVRDSEGLIVGGTCCRVSSVSAPIVVEALAGRAACAWAVEFKQAPIIFESDCLQLVNYLKAEEEDHSIIGRVIDDIVVHLASIPSSFFQHIYRESNLDAHKLAKLALYSNVSANWKGPVPSTMGSFVASYCNTSSH